MADKKISALTGATTPLAGTEVLPIVQGGSTVKVSIADVTAGRAVTALSVVNGLGAVGTPSYTFSGDLNTGIWSPAADTLAFSEGGVEAMRITSESNIGIGTTAPVDYSVFGYGPTVEARGARGGSFVTSSSDAAVRGVLAVDSSAAVFYMKTVTNNALAFGVNDTEYWRVNTSGNLAPSVAGKGIDFSANTHAAGMTSELLTWYEEGNWTPTFTFGTPGDLNIVYSSQVGKYTRIGRTVHVEMTLATSTFTHTTAAGNATINGLPFTIGGTDATTLTGACGGYVNVTYPILGVQLFPTVSSIFLVKGGPGAGAPTTFVDFPSGGTLYITFQATYII